MSLGERRVEKVTRQGEAHDSFAPLAVPLEDSCDALGQPINRDLWFILNENRRFRRDSYFATQLWIVASANSVRTAERGRGRFAKTSIFPDAHHSRSPQRMHLSLFRPPIMSSSFYLDRVPARCPREARNSSLLGG